MLRNNLGNLHRHPNRMEEARKESEEVRKIDREPAQKNPEIFLPNLANKLNNLGNLRRHPMEEAWK